MPVLLLINAGVEWLPVCSEKGQGQDSGIPETANFLPLLLLLPLLCELKRNPSNLTSPGIPVG